MKSSVELVKIRIRELNMNRAQLLGMGFQSGDSQVRIISQKLEAAISELQQLEGRAHVSRR